MPTYEYKCQDCGHTFEKFQSMKDKPIAKCPECNGKVHGRERPCCGRDVPCDKKPCE